MDTSHVREVYVENKLDYGKLILEPKIEATYKEITKDLALSNLDNKKIFECELRQEILNIIVLHNCKPWLPNSFEAFERDQHTTLQLHRSKGGFQSKLERSNLSGDASSNRPDDKNQSKNMFEQGGKR
jgi:hypothetical protein